MARNQKDSEYHILAAAGAESQLRGLLAIGCALASAHDGRVTLLSVTASGQPPVWLRKAEGEQGAAAEQAPAGAGFDHTPMIEEICGPVPVSIVVRGGRDPASEILAAAREDPPDLILLGWRGTSPEASGGGYLLGRTLDPVVQYAPCDVAVVRADEQRPLDDALAGIHRILVPVAGGPNAALAIDLALTLSPEAEITALNIARTAQGEVALSLSDERLAESLIPWKEEPRVRGKVIQASTPIEGILAEAGRGYDLVMIGASHESYLDRVLFGNVPQTVAARSPVPAIVVRRLTSRMRMGTFLRRTGWRLYGMLPTLSLHEQIEVHKTIRDGARPDSDFFIMIGLASAIASFGLLQNSPAVIIGAMLVAPLMSAISGISLGIVRGDLRLLRRAASAILRGVLLTIAVGLMFTLLVPNATAQTEILSRTHPTLLDLGVALASGAAGAYALCRRDVSASLPGVAIAAALVPPLSTVGIGLALRDGQIAGGAMLLFTTNLVAISSAGGLVFLWLGFRPLLGKQARARVFQSGLLGVIVMLLAVSTILGIYTVDSVRKAQLNTRVTRALRVEIAAMEDVAWDGQWTMVEREDGTLDLDVQVRSPRTLVHREVVDLQERVAGYLERPVALVLSVIRTTNLDPFVPPTPTPTPLPGATATLTPSATPSPTATSTPQPSATLSPTAVDTATLTPTATASPTSTPTSTSTATHTPTFTPTPDLVQVGGTGGLGVWMYREPGLSGGKIAAWRDGTVLTVIGDTVEADGYVWLNVLDPKGRFGWIPEKYSVRLVRVRR